ncbi:MAG: hypothetical protein AB7V46_20405, partial [Thermomicrobiales bacterium]
KLVKQSKLLSEKRREKLLSIIEGIDRSMGRNTLDLQKCAMCTVIERLLAHGRLYRPRKLFFFQPALRPVNFLIDEAYDGSEVAISVGDVVSRFSVTSQSMVLNIPDDEGNPWMEGTIYEYDDGNPVENLVVAPKRVQVRKLDWKTGQQVGETRIDTFDPYDAPSDEVYAPF